MKRSRYSELPKQFNLQPTADGSMKVSVAAQCVGYIWPEAERWCARNTAGESLDTGAVATVHAAVSAIFRDYQQQPFARVQ
ncbi:MAG: hypothetical protein GFH24_608434n26 [Chloroflexi bacterium AL-N5]|nr:hypothetical protein [Chloroflexi bacterium AL-N5]